jgi:hypothetical protein
MPALNASRGVGEEIVEDDSGKGGVNFTGSSKARGETPQDRFLQE